MFRVFDYVAYLLNSIFFPGYANCILYDIYVLCVFFMLRFVLNILLTLRYALE